MGHRAEWIVALVCLLLYLPGFFSMPAIDRDEARFVQASRQMLEADSWHDLVVPRVQDRPRLQKPPLIYWAQSASAWMFTGKGLGNAFQGPDAVWMYRFPSLIAAILVCMVTIRLARRMYAPPVAALAGFLMACNPVMFWEARQGRSDMVMLAFTVASVYALWRVIENRGAVASWRHVMMLWCMVSLGVLTKGPVPLMVIMLSVIAYCALDRSARVLRAVRPVVGIVLVFAPITGWVVLLSREIDLAIYFSKVWSETGGRAAAAMEGHGGPAGYHVLMMYAAFFPGCMLAVPAVLRALRLAVHRRGHGWSVIRHARLRHRPEAFLLAVLIPSWIVFETSGTKLPHYTLPLYPILAILSARMVYAAPKYRALAGRTLSVLLAVFAMFTGILPIVALTIAGYMLFRAGATHDAAGLIGLGLIFGIAFGSACFRFVRAQRYFAAQSCAIAALCFAAIPLGYCAGHWPDMQLSRNVASAIDELDPAGVRPIAAVALHEDSIIFETRGRAERVNEWRLKAWLSEHSDAIVVLDAERAAYWSRFAVLERVEGLNYSNGKHMRLVVGEFIASGGAGATP